ncbi:MAG: hypothetical protein WKF77_31265, partial [Planctomycetaceae bacterium]
MAGDLRVFFVGGLALFSAIHCHLATRKATCALQWALQRTKAVDRHFLVLKVNVSVSLGGQHWSGMTSQLLGRHQRDPVAGQVGDIGMSQSVEVGKEAIRIHVGNTSIGQVNLQHLSGIFIGSPVTWPQFATFGLCTEPNVSLIQGYLQAAEGCPIGDVWNTQPSQSPSADWIPNRVDRSSVRQ